MNFLIKTQKYFANIMMMKCHDLSIPMQDLIAGSKIPNIMFGQNRNQMPKDTPTFIMVK